AQSTSRRAAPPSPITRKTRTCAPNSRPRLKPRAYPRAWTRSSTRRRTAIRNKLKILLPPNVGEGGVCVSKRWKNIKEQRDDVQSADRGHGGHPRLSDGKQDVDGIATRACRVAHSEVREVGYIRLPVT